MSYCDLILNRGKFAWVKRQSIPEGNLIANINAVGRGCLGFVSMYVARVLGCKHSKVDQTSAPVYESRGFLGQMPISSSKMLFKIDYFS